MKHRLLKSCAGLAVTGTIIFSVARVAHAESLAPSTDQTIASSGELDGGEARAQSVWGPIYRPPFPNAPRVRVDGLSRGADDAALALTVLAPEHVGLTTKDQPSLFWFQSKAVRTRFELTIVAAREVKPILETQLDEPPTDGIQRFRLADHGVKLKKDVDYRWSVAMVLDPDNRSKDVVASGVIRRIAPSAALVERLAKSPSDAAAIYADEGIWYDSMEALSDSIEQQPQDKVLHEERAMFFMQVGLKDAAVYDARTASAK